MQASRYTFILTAYRGRFLTDAIDSILQQTYGDFRLVIVDDASPDPLGDIVGTYDDSRITYIRHQANTGGRDLVAHWNNCLDYADSQYVILASDDDIYESGFLAAVDCMIDRYPQCDVIQARARFVDQQGKMCAISPMLGPCLSMTEYCYAFKTQQIISSLQNNVFKLSALRRIGGFVSFPLAWHSDDATILALSANGVAMTQQVLFTFRNTGYNISSHKNDAKVIAQKMQSRAMFAHWIDTVYVPMLSSACPDSADDQFLVHDLSRYMSIKLDGLNASMCHSTDTRTLWRARRTIMQCRNMSRMSFAKMLVRKNLKNYAFVLKPSTWLRLLSKK